MFDRKVSADKYEKAVKEHKKFMPFCDGDEIIPVDMNGKRVSLKKDTESNMKKTAEENKTFYGLD